MKFFIIHEDGRRFYGVSTEPAEFAVRQEADTVAAFFNSVYGPLTVVTEEEDIRAFRSTGSTPA